MAKDSRHKSKLRPRPQIYSPDDPIIRVINTLCAERGVAAAMARRLNKDDSTVKRMKEGKSHIDMNDLRVIAEMAGVTVAKLFNNQPVRVVGYVEAGNTSYFDASEQDIDEVDRPLRATDRTVAVVVRGNSMMGDAPDGSYVFYDDVQSPPPESPRPNQMFVVWLENGHVVLKRMQRGSRSPSGRLLYHLTSLNAEPMLEQEVRSAAPVLLIEKPFDANSGNGVS